MLNHVQIIEDFDPIRQEKYYIIRGESFSYEFSSGGEAFNFLLGFISKHPAEVKSFERKYFDIIDPKLTEKAGTK